MLVVSGTPCRVTLTPSYLRTHAAHVVPDRPDNPESHDGSLASVPVVARPPSRVVTDARRGT